MKIIARIVSKFAFINLILTLIITVLLGYFIKDIKVQTELESGLPDNLPEVIAQNKVNELFPPQDVIFIVVKSDSIFSLSYMKKIYELTDSILFLKEVEDVFSIATANKIKGEEKGISIIPLMEKMPETEEEVKRIKEMVSGDEIFEGMLLSKDKKSTAILALIDKELSEEEKIEIYEKILKITKKYENPEKIHVSGKPVVEALIAERVQGDIRRLFPFSILLSMILLFIFFGSLRGAFLPVLTVFISTVWMMGIQGLLGIPIGMETSLLPMLLVAIGTAYGIHLIHQFTEEIEKEEKMERVVYNLILKRGNAVLIAGLTTVAGFFSLVFQDIKTIKTFGIVNGFGVLVTLFLSIFLIPSFLRILKKPKKAIREIKTLDKFLFLSGSSVTKRYYAFLIAGLLIIIFGTMGVLWIKSESNEIENFSKKSNIRISYEYINENYAGTTPLTILFETEKEDGFKNPELLKIVDRIVEYSENLPYVGKARSITGLLKRLYKSFENDKEEFYRIPDEKELVSQLVFLFEMSTDPEELARMVTSDWQKVNVTLFLKTSNTRIMRDIVKRIEEYSKSLIKNTDIKLTITGRARLYVIMDYLIIKGQILSLISAFILVLIITSLILKSFKLGILSIIPMTMVVMGNFGFMGFLGFPLTHSTSIVASLAIGIGIDYAVHYINRMNLLRGKVGDINEIIRRTTLSVGKAIIFNMVSVTLGFLVLLLSSFKGVKLISILIAITMILSLFGALFILPSFVKLITKKEEKI